MKQLISQVLAIITSVIMFFLSAAGITVKKNELDLSDYTLVWEDEFDAATVNKKAWIFGAGTRRGGYWDDSTVFTEDGNLIIRTQYQKNGDYGPGFYTGSLTSKKQWCRGYFETRCKCPYGAGIWSAFWMNCDGMNEITGNAKSGAELDIFEAPFSESTIYSFRNKVECSVHYDGYGDAHESYLVARTAVPLPYTTFNTYGMKWDEKGYTFYINGAQVGYSEFGGSSETPEYMILSTEIGGENGVPAKSWAGAALTDKDFTADFVVDYVRVYQVK